MIALSLIAGYFIGSIPFAVILARMKGIDILTAGSGNPGPSNVFKEVGKEWGIAAWALDTVKGAGAMFVATKLITGGWIVTPETRAIDLFFVMLCGMAAFLGHCKSVWIGFKGGKGVAVTGGIFLYVIPRVFLVAVIGHFLIQRKPREPWVIISVYVAVMFLMAVIYWAERAWLAPSIAIFLIVGAAANIPVLKEVKYRRKLDIQESEK
jgi:acyl-phosphate glycerol 3-phosphate acyltransferase